MLSLWLVDHDGPPGVMQNIVTDTSQQRALDLGIVPVPHDHCVIVVCVDSLHNHVLGLSVQDDVVIGNLGNK